MHSDIQTDVYHNATLHCTVSYGMIGLSRIGPASPLTIPTENMSAQSLISGELISETYFRNDSLAELIFGAETEIQIYPTPPGHVFFFVEALHQKADLKF